MMLRLIVLLFSLSALSTQLWAHGDLHERIAKLTKQIKKSPKDPSLYFKRATLYYHHEEYKKARNDFDQSKQLGGKDKALPYWYGRVYLAMEKPDSGILHLQPYIQNNGQDVNAHRVLAKLYVAKKDWANATIHFRSLIDHADPILPENYLELTHSLQEQKDYETALKTLQEAQTKLGELVVIQNALVDLYVEVGDYETAVDIYDQRIAKATRREKLYYQAATLLYEGNMWKYANDYLHKAEEEWDDLPTRIKNTKAMQKLKQEMDLLHQKL